MRQKSLRRVALTLSLAGLAGADRRIGARESR